MTVAHGGRGDSNMTPIPTMSTQIAPYDPAKAPRKRYTFHAHKQNGGLH